jgi:DNA processing protein
LASPQASLFASTDEPTPEDHDADAGLLSALGHDPVTFDTLAARSGLPSNVLSARLLTLELEGKVARLPGGLLQRQSRA